MGAEFNFEKLKATNAVEARKEGEALIKQAQYDHGHAGYSGSWAECSGVMIMTCGPDVSSDSIEDWLDEHCQKWDPMTLVECDGRWYAGAVCSS